ncbi:MAG: restriction endonuclease subunit S [Pseudomonas sp.]|nr:restriction endonuclease subunit S [Pseudomonas sp.]
MKAGWERTTLGAAFTTATGTTPPKSNADYYGQYMPLVKPPELCDAPLDSAEDGLTEAGAAVARTLPPNSILVSCIGNLGKVGLNTVPVAFNQQINAILPNESKATPEFLFYQVLSCTFKEQLEAMASGTTVSIVNKSKFNSIEIVLPPLPEQQRIVGILDEAFEGIATATANAEKNLHNARALFESHLQSVFSQRGEGWVEKQLEEIVDGNCTLSYGIVQPGNDYTNGLPVVRPTDLTSKLITPEGLKLIDPKLAEGYRRTTLRGGELLLCVRGSTGVISVAAPELVGANVTRGIVPIMFNPDLLRQDFGYFLMTSEPIQNQIREKTYGAALMQINIGDLRKIVVSYPNLSVQAELSERLQDISTETHHLKSIYQQKLSALDALKKSLLDQAFRGEL